MENQPTRMNWLRLATIARAADADPQPQPEPVQPAQAPAAPVSRQPTLPIVRVPVVPLPVTQPRALVPPAPPAPSAPPAPPATQPTSQPIVQQQGVSTAVQPAQPSRRPATPPVQPAPVDRKPVTPPQPDTPKSAVPTSNNGTSKPLTAPSPPPSPKVIKTSTPTPPASPRVKLPPQLSPISVPRTADPEAETKSPLVPSPLKPVATQENGGNKANGNNGSYNNTNTIKSINGNADTSGKMNGAPYNNGLSKNGTGSNAKDTGSHNNHGNMNHTPHLEKKETENGQGMYEARAKPRSSHEKSEKDMKVVTLAGENIGAIMELGHNAHGYNRKMHHGGKTLTGESPAQNGKATESMNDKHTARSKPMTSLVNSNVQSINNSLLFNSSCTQKSPGVHLTFKTKGKGKTHK